MFGVSNVPHNKDHSSGISENPWEIFFSVFDISLALFSFRVIKLTHPLIDLPYLLQVRKKQEKLLTF